MNSICVRLRRGADLKRSISELAVKYDIRCGYILSAAGCLSSARIRCADGKTIYNIDRPHEIVSLTGTVGIKRCHLHISLAGTDLSVIGGHLAEGCIVNTTCELIIGIADGWSIDTFFDPETGYDELEFIKE